MQVNVKKDERNIMSSIKRIIKQIGYVKRYRAKQRLAKVVLRYFLSPDTIKACEDNPGRIESVLKKHAEKWPEKTSSINGRIDEIAYHLPDITNEIRQDMLFHFFAYGFSPNEYLCYDLRRKTAEERHAFLSDRESVCYGYRMNDIDRRIIFMDKMETYARFAAYYHREAICVESESDKEAFLDFCSRHPIFVKKEVLETCGRSIERVDLRSCTDLPEDIFYRLLNGKKLIIEEIVSQSEVMASLNPSSVNTIRCLTINTRHGIVTPWCFLKVGRSGSFVDNGGAGGILVGIDVESGKLNTTGIDELGHRFESHPDNGLNFSGFQLPEWKEMLSVCCEMATLEPKNKWIGWDMAHTDQGWVVIEGNALSEVIGPQSTSGIGIRAKLDSYLQDVDLFM